MTNIFGLDRTIKEAVMQKSNDYSSEEKKFERLTGLKFLTSRSQKIDVNKIKERVSIVIPAYMGHATLPLLLASLENQKYKNFEVIIIDDASPLPLKTLMIHSTFKTSYSVKFITHSANKGRPYTRNTGITVAEGSTIITMDQDMIPSEDFVLNFAARQEYTQDCVFLGSLEFFFFRTNRI